MSPFVVDIDPADFVHYQSDDSTILPNRSGSLRGAVPLPYRRTVRRNWTCKSDPFEVCFVHASNRCTGSECGVSLTRPHFGPECSFPLRSTRGYMASSSSVPRHSLRTHSRRAPPLDRQVLRLRDPKQLGRLLPFQPSVAPHVQTAFGHSSAGQRVSRLRFYRSSTPSSRVSSAGNESTLQGGCQL